MHTPHRNKCINSVSFELCKSSTMWKEGFVTTKKTCLHCCKILFLTLCCCLITKIIIIVLITASAGRGLRHTRASPSLYLSAGCIFDNCILSSARLGCSHLVNQPALRPLQVFVSPPTLLPSFEIHSCFMSLQLKNI